MAKGGNTQRSNGSRFTTPYNSSNSFVTKVASRVSDYLGGWFGTPLKTTGDETKDATSATASGDTSVRHVFENVEAKRSLSLPHRCFDDLETMNSPAAKRFKLSEKEKLDIDFPISPIPSTSGLFQNTINDTLDAPKSEDLAATDPGPSSLTRQRYSQSNNVATATSSTSTDVKANGATDNHSDSSESTSGCSSLVPQSDRLSQSAYVCSSRKRNLEDKLKYARQLQHSRAAMYLNRSIPVSDAPGVRKKPSFDVTAYGTPSLDKSLLREKLINSPFYTGQTSYGGASAYRLSRNTFYSQRNPKHTGERREGLQVQVKPSHHGSTEDLTNMSHTAKKILEALEQFSTPVNDAKRIPINRLNVPLGSKRRRFDEASNESRLKLSTPISPLNPNAGPVITGLNMPTVPDLLKLKRLERIQNSTAAARQVAVQKTEYTLPSDGPPPKRTGKIVTKLKNKEKDVPLEMVEEVNLPKIPLPITTLPKFDFQLPTATTTAGPAKTSTSTTTTAASAAAPSVTKKEETQKDTRSRNFKFSPPISILVSAMPERTCEPSAQKTNFLFSDPLRADGKKSEPENPAPPFGGLTNFMSSDAVAKLKRKSINDSTLKSSGSSPLPPVVFELKTGSVMDFLSKSGASEKGNKEAAVKPSSGTWECVNCLIRNLNDSKICCGCKAERVSEEKERTCSSSCKVDVPSSTPPQSKPLLVSGFGDKFKPPTGSWSCKECFVNNNASASKCVACETPKVSAGPAKQAPPPVEPAKPPEVKVGFGDMFKKPANQWECSVCMIRNKETDAKCAACETPKPGSKAEKVEPKFNFGTGPVGGGFLFGIDKAGTDAVGVKSAADSSTFKIQTNGPQNQSPSKPSQLNAISTSVGVFTFGIPPAQNKKEEPAKAESPKEKAEATNNRFLVTSTSGSGLRKDEPPCEQSADKESSLVKGGVDGKEKESSVSDSSKAASEAPKPFIFGSTNIQPFFGSSPVDKVSKEKAMEPEAKGAKFFFGSNSNSLETVSSSTTDFTFRRGPSQANALDSGLSKPAATFQFKPFGASEQPSLNSNSNIMAPSENESKTEPASSAVSTSAAVTTSSQLFGSPSNFNGSTTKMAFGTAPTSSSSSGFGSGSLSSTSASPFVPSTQSFTSGFGAQPLAPSVQNSFGIVPPSTVEKPALGSTNAFGAGAGTFPNVMNPFTSAAASSSGPAAAPKPFAGFGSNVPNFGAAQNSTPAFGSGFLQQSNPAAEKPPAAPFIFGASAPASAPTNTSAPAPAAAPEVFMFGASKPETSAPQFSFSQNSGLNFNFGSNAPATNVFGGFGQPKPENSLGATNSPFGTSTPSVFGQSSAPAAAKFEFGARPAQPQETAPSLFQFGAAPAQPATAPPGTGFSLSVPQKFNFTGGQTPVFSAEPSSEDRPNRKFIKAVRRTNRDNTRRPN